MTDPRPSSSSRERVAVFARLVTAGRATVAAARLDRLLADAYRAGRDEAATDTAGSSR